MTIVESICSQSDVASSFNNYRRDTLTLSWEDRRHGHGKRTSDGGLEFAISLPSGTVLKSGDCMVLEPEHTIVEVQEASEPVYIVRPTSPQQWAFCAYHVGNRHQQVMIAETELIFLQNPAVKSLFEQLHIHYDIGVRPFTGALATGHSH